MTDQGETARASVFLERQSYRRRRLVDAARLVPVLGLLLWLVPLLWATEGEAPTKMSTAILYLFLVWGGLVALKLVISLSLREDGPDSRDGLE